MINSIKKEPNQQEEKLHIDNCMLKFVLLIRDRDMEGMTERSRADTRNEGSVPSE